MTNYTQQQLQERYDKLPEDLKKAMYSVENADAIQKISKKYGLMIDQMGELALETGLVMLGLTRPKDYIKNLSGRLGVDMDTAKKIAQEVNVEIFSPVKEHLKKIHDIEKERVNETPKSFELTQKHKPQESPEEKRAEISEVPEFPKPPTPKPKEETLPEKKPTTTIFPEKIQEKSFRKPSQTTEIEEPKETPPLKIEKGYKGNDPYKEPIEN